MKQLLFEKFDNGHYLTAHISLRTGIYFLKDLLTQNKRFRLLFID
jgi:hypothetical protein